MLLEYLFFRHALLGALLVSLCCGIIGTYVVTRRRVFIAGGITHASLGGLGLGIFAGLNPTWVAVVFAVLAAWAVQWLSSRRNIREDSAIAVCWSFGMALGIIFIFLTPGYAPSLTEYLFGNILTITTADLRTMGIFTAFLLLFQIICQRAVLYVAFDAPFAQIQRFHASLIDYMMNALTAVAIVLSIRMVGIVLLLSVLTLPQMMASLFCTEYRRMVVLSCLLCFAGCVGGLLLSIALNVPAGACIVALMVAVYLAMRGVLRLARRRRVSAAAVVLMTGAALMLSGCKSNTALNRNMRAFTTRYNPYFNGEEAYKKGLASMESQQDDEYSERIFLHPVYKYVGKEPGTEANFQRAVEKCKICVQTKSMSAPPKSRPDNPSKEYREWVKHSEFNPFLHNAWLLSGKAQFMMGNFDAAEATFHYTARKFYWKDLLQQECHIWLARCAVMKEDFYAAEAELEQVIPAKNYTSQKMLQQNGVYQNLPARLQKEFSLVKAEMLLLQPGNEALALDYLSKGQQSFTNKDQRVRARFFMAQLHEELSHKAETAAEREAHRSQAYKMYRNITRHARNYKTQFNARIAATRVMPAGNLDKVERKLRHLSWQARNKEYLDQICYALGNVELARKDTAKAVSWYERAMEKSTRGGLDKAVAALRMGELTFQQADYVRAQKGYSTAMGIIKDNYPGYDSIKQLSQVLDALQTHAESVHLQDSLLTLAALPEDSLYDAIDAIIENLKRQEKEADEAKKQQAYNDKQATRVDPLAQADPEIPQVGTQDKSWYFYNPSVITRGKQEFQRRWGARKPEDDWRRKDKTSSLLAAAEEMQDSIAMTGDAGPTDALMAETAHDEPDMAAAAVNPAAESGLPEAEAAPADSAFLEKAQDPHNREYYLAQLPFTQEQQDACHALIEEGLYNEGVIINEQLENFPLAIRTFGEVERRYPESARRLDMWYATYLMYMRMNRPDKAEIYRQKLMEGFPEAAYTKAVADPNYIQNLRAMVAGQDSMYIRTYEDYLAGHSTQVHESYFWVHDNWPLSNLMPKFIFLHALSYVQEGDVKSFQEALEQLTATYPNSDVSPLAGMMVKGIREGRNVQTGATNRGMMWGSSLHREGDTTAVDTTMMFVNDLKAPFVLLLAYQTDSVQQNDLLFEIAKFNFESFLVKDFDLEIINTGGGLSVLVISQFADISELLDYHNKMDASETLWLPENITMIDISVPNFRALLAGRTFEEYFEWVDKTYGSGDSETSDNSDNSDSSDPSDNSF